MVVAVPVGVGAVGDMLVDMWVVGSQLDGKGREGALYGLDIVR
jgi:hypothetical protein